MLAGVPVTAVTTGTWRASDKDLAPWEFSGQQLQADPPGPIPKFFGPTSESDTPPAISQP